MKNDDSTVSSLEEGFDSFQYTVTVKYDDGLHLETFVLDACGDNPSSSGGLLLSGDFYPILNVDPFNVERPFGGKHLVLKENPAGRVCICSLDGLKDINMVFRIAASNGAAALLTVKEPTELNETGLPCFVVTKETMVGLSSRKNFTVKFQCHQKLDDSAEESEASSSPNSEGVPRHVGGAAAPGQFVDAELAEIDTKTPPGAARNSSISSNSVSHGDEMSESDPESQEGVSAPFDEVPRDLASQAGDVSKPIDLSSVGPTNGTDMPFEESFAAEQSVSRSFVLKSILAALWNSF